MTKITLCETLPQPLPILWRYIGGHGASQAATLTILVQVFLGRPVGKDQTCAGAEGTTCGARSIANTSGQRASTMRATTSLAGHTECAKNGPAMRNVRSARSQFAAATASPTRTTAHARQRIQRWPTTARVRSRASRLLSTYCSGCATSVTNLRTALGLKGSKFLTSTIPLAILAMRLVLER